MDGILLINKPLNMTSHDVVSRVRRISHHKVGHSGTLDPQATGLLIILIGSATKLTPYLNTHTKTYVATCHLGTKTDTGDIWGEKIDESPIIEFHSQLTSVLDSFKGHSQQVTPMVSAVKVGGKKLYEYHRENKKVETPLRNIEINDIKLIAMDHVSFTFEATVSSGTYIRTLCEDIATKLGMVGTMSALERTQIGHFDLASAVELSSLNSENWMTHLIDKRQALSHFEMIEADNPADIMAGKSIEVETVVDEVVVTHRGSVLAIYERIKGSNQFKSKRGLW